MAQNKVVVKFKNGEILKGSTSDFLPKRVAFHLSVTEKGATDCREIVVDSLKAIFFVKDFQGSKAHLPPLPEHQRLKPKEGDKYIEATFLDNEVIAGISHSFHLDRPGFFMAPVDPRSNNERIYVVLSAVDHLLVDGKEIAVKELRKANRLCPTCKSPMEFNWSWCPFDGTKVGAST